MDQNRKYIHNWTSPSPEESTLRRVCLGISEALGDQSLNSLPLQSMSPTENQVSILPFHGSFSITEINQSINTVGSRENYDNVTGWLTHEQPDQGIFSNCTSQNVTNFIHEASTLFPGYQVILEPYAEPQTYSNHTELQEPGYHNPAATLGIPLVKSESIDFTTKHVSKAMYDCSSDNKSQFQSHLVLQGSPSQPPQGHETVIIEKVPSQFGVGTFPQEIPVIQEFAGKEDNSEHHDQVSFEFRSSDEPKDVLTNLGAELQARIAEDVNWYISSVEQLPKERTMESHTVSTGNTQSEAAGTDMDELIRTRFLLKLHQQVAKITQIIIRDNDPFN